jgi:hypothetical protein
MKQLPLDTQKAINDRLGSVASNPNFQYVVDQLKDEKISIEIKNKLADAVVKKMLQEAKTGEDPNLTPFSTFH